MYPPGRYQLKSCRRDASGFTTEEVAVGVMLAVRTARRRDAVLLLIS
jgi:hypothetical protein